jgi:hypothetical protein
MALQKQVIRMSAEGSLDTKTDTKNVLPTNFLELENVRFTNTGAFTKRPGYEAYTKSILNSSSQIETGKALTTFKDELLRYSDTQLYSYSESEDKWVDKGSTQFALSGEYSVTSTGDKLTQPSHATISNLTCYVYRWDKVATNGVKYRIVDNNTGSVIYTGAVEASANYPHVCALHGTFFIFYQLSGVVKFRTINFSTPYTISAATNALTADYFTVGKVGQRAYVVGDAATGLNVVYVDQDSNVVGPTAVADVDGGFNRFSVSAEQTNSVRITYGHSSTGTCKTVLYAADMNYQIHAPVTIGASLAVYSLGSVQSPVNPNKSHVYVSGTNDHLIYLYTITSAGTLVIVNHIYQASLQSKPQSYGDKVYFIASKNTTYLTSGPVYAPFRTYFLVSEDGIFLNKFTNDAGVFREGAAGLPNMNVEGTQLCFCGAEAAELQANVATASVTVPTTIKKFSSDFNSTNNYFDAALGENLHIAGGILKMYDGNQVVEHGFLLTPETPVFVTQSGSGAVLPDGSYQYLVVYKWLDKAGQVHRSITSLPLTYEVVSGPRKPTIRVFTLPFTSKDDVEIEVYRTEANGTIFYKRSYNYSDRIVNDKTVESITFTDTMDDASLIQNEVLYTTGGVLDNSTAGSSKSITTYKSRVFLLLSDGYTLQYSKKREQNEPVEFPEEFKLPIDAAGGPGTALATMDDHIIIFKERAIFALGGEGPNSLGELNDFREPQLVTTDAGCIDTNSVVTTPEGLMFKSSKGIYLLARNFSVQYKGAPVEAYNSDTVTSANLLPGTNEIRFTLDNDKSIVYDYFHNKWATDTNIRAVDAVVYRNVYTYIRANADLMAETAGVFSDNGSYIKMKISSSWIQVAGIQGFERFYKLLVLGSYKSAHLLKVKFAYDFDPTWVNEATVDAGTVLGTDEYGDDATYGASAVYGGEYPLYQFRIFPKIQKCEAFKFQIEDFKTSGNGEGLSLSNFAAEVGLKPSAYKKSDSKSFAAS